MKLLFGSLSYGKMDDSSNPPMASTSTADSPISYDEPSADSKSNIHASYFSHDRMYKSQGYEMEDSRKRRRETTVQIRKDKRMELLDSRRGLLEDKAFDFENNYQPPCLISTEIHAKITSDVPTERVQGFQELKQLMLVSPVPIMQSIAASNLLPSIIMSYLTSSPDPATHDITSWILKNLNRKPADQLDQIDDIRSVFCDMLASELDDYMLWPILFALTHLILDSVATRNYVLQHPVHVVQRIVYICTKRTAVQIIQQAVRLISTLFYNINQHTPNLESLTPLLPVTMAALTNDHEMTVLDALQAFVNMSENHCLLARMADKGVFNFVVDMLPTESVIAGRQLIRILMNATADTSAYSSELFNRGLLDHLNTLLKRPGHELTHDIFYLIGNLVTEGNYGRQAMIDAGLLHNFRNAMATAPFSASREALFVINHCAASSNMEHRGAVVDAGLLHVLLDFLTVSDYALISKVLDTLTNLLEYGEWRANQRGERVNSVLKEIDEQNGRSRFEYLISNSTSLQVHGKTYDLVDKYFDDDEEEMIAREMAEPYSSDATQARMAAIDATLEDVAKGLFEP